MSDFQSQNPYHVYGQQPGLLGLLNTAMGKNAAFPLPPAMGGAGAPAQPIPPQGMSLPAPMPGSYSTTASAGAGAQAAAPAPGPGGGSATTLPSFLSQMFQKPSNSNAMIGLGMGLLGGKGRADGFTKALEGYGRGVEQDRKDKDEKETKERQEQFKLIAKSIYPEGSPLAKMAETHPDLVAQTTAQEMLQEKWTEHTLQNGTKVLRSSRGDMKAIPKAEAGEIYDAIGLNHEVLTPDPNTGKYNGVVIGQRARSTGKTDYAPGYTADRKTQTYDDNGNLTGEVSAITGGYEPKQTPFGAARTTIDINRQSRVKNEDELAQDEAQTRFRTNEQARGAQLSRINLPQQIAQRDAERAKEAVSQTAVAQGSRVMSPEEVQQKIAEEARKRQDAIAVGQQSRIMDPREIDQKGAERRDQLEVDIDRWKKTQRLFDPPVQDKFGNLIQQDQFGRIDKYGETGIKNAEQMKQALDIANANNSKGQTAFEKMDDETRAKTIENYRLEGQKAREALPTLGINEALLTKSSFKAGYGAGLLGKLSSGLAVAGLGDGTLAGMQDLFSGNQARAVLQSLGSLGNQISNADRGYVAEIFGAITQTTGSLKALNAYQQIVAERKVKVAQELERYRASNVDPQMKGWEKHLNEWSNKEGNGMLTKEQTQGLVKLAQGGDEVDIRSVVEGKGGSVVRQLPANLSTGTRAGPATVAQPPGPISGTTKSGIGYKEVVRP